MDDSSAETVGGEKESAEINISPPIFKDQLSPDANVMLSPKRKF